MQIPIADPLTVVGMTSERRTWSTALVALTIKVPNSFITIQTTGRISFESSVMDVYNVKINFEII